MPVGTLLLDVVGEGENEKKREQLRIGRDMGDGAHALMRGCWVDNQSCIDLRKKVFFPSHCQVIVLSFRLLMGLDWDDLSVSATITNCNVASYFTKLTLNPINCGMVFS